MVEACGTCEMRGVHTGFWWKNMKERDHFQHLDVDGRTVLQWIFIKFEGWAWTAWIRPTIGQMTGACKCGNEHSGSIKCGKFLD